MSLRNRLVSGVLALLAFAFVSGVAFGKTTAPKDNGLVAEGKACLDNAVLGEELTTQQEAYESARDSVESFQRGEIDMTADQLTEKVSEEGALAVKSWVRAAIYCYLGALQKQGGIDAASREAYQAAIYYAKLAKDFNNGSPAEVTQSQNEGAKFYDIAHKALKPYRQHNEPSRVERPAPSDTE